MGCIHWPDCNDTGVEMFWLSPSVEELEILASIKSRESLKGYTEKTRQLRISELRSKP